MYLLKQTEGRDFYYLLEDKEYVVGRKHADIIIDDQSISRRHAVLKVKKDKVIVVDCESKYGTFVNGTKITANIEVTWKETDIVRFGVYKSTYRIEKVNIVTTGSGLNDEQKKELKNKIQHLGGTVLPNWDDTCTNVTTQEIILTIKVLHAVIDEKPIVTLQYWDEYISRVRKSKTLPDPEEFKPPVAETLINKIDLSPNPQRKILFKDKIFVFPAEKIKNRMASLITKASGSSISWQKQPVPMSQLSKSSKDYIFINCDDIKDTPQTLKEIFEYLTKLGERAIPIQEIAMAVVLASCEKDCNPKFNRVHCVFMGQPAASSVSEVFPLAAETPSDFGDSPEKNETKKEIVIPESLDTDLQMITSNKTDNGQKRNPKQPQNNVDWQIPTPSTSSKNDNGRDKSLLMFPSTKRPEKDSGNNTAPKKFKLDCSITETQLKKRKADNESDISPPMFKKPSLKENPFATLRNKLSAKKSAASDNPFTSMRIRKEVKQNDDNPFKNIMVSGSSSTANISTVSNTKETSVKSTSVTQSNQSYSCTDISNLDWKLKTKDTDSEKHIEIDEEFKEIFEQFKNVTVIEIVPCTTTTTLMSRLLSQTFNDTSENSGNKKNFKKFKKCTPRHVQTRIISLIGKEAIKVEENDNQVISLLEDGDDDEDKEIIKRPTTKKAPKKRFVF